MKDPKHLKTLRGMPCAIWAQPNMVPCDFALATGVGPGKCFGPVEAHHPVGGGLALKTSDHEAFPLCLGHHKARHDVTGLFRETTKARMKAWERSMSGIYRPKKGDF